MSDFINKNFLNEKLFSSLFETINKFDLLNKNDRVLIGLSGGADSVFLTYLICYLRDIFSLDIATCHINHNLRKEESLRDEDFCRSFSKRLNIPFYSFNFDVSSIAKKEKMTIEEAARYVRYNAFLSLCNEKGFNKIAVAHNLDDLVETLFYRILKGTGVSGLISIPIKKNLENVCIIRPLLFVKKDEILKNLNDNKIEFVFDSSNNDNSFLRNFIRNKVLPLIDSRFFSYKDKIRDLYLILWEEERYWGDILLSYENYIKREKDRIIIDKSFFKNDIVIKRRLIRKVINEIDRNLFLPLRIVDGLLFPDEKGLKILYKSKKIVIYSEYGNLCFKKQIEDYGNDILFFIDKNSSFEVSGFRFKFDFRDKNEYNNFISNNERIFFSFSSGKLIFRRMKKGDRIFLSKDKSKKLSDIFIDSKINRLDRRKAFVLVDEMDDVILVIIPLVFTRVSFKYYVNEETEKIGIVYVEKC